MLRLLECSDRILDLSKVNFVPFEDNEPLISITDGTIFSKIITKEDMSQVSKFQLYIQRFERQHFLQ